MEIYQKYFKEESLIKELEQEAKVQDVPAGTVLIEEGAYLKVVPIVLSGTVKVFQSDENREMLLYYINPHESCIMSIAVTFKNEKTAFKAVADTDVKLLLLPARLIPEWQRQFESFNLFINQLYKKKFEDLLGAFNAIAFQKMDNRLLDYLNHRLMENEVIKSTHQEIADELGTARETISRLLKKLELEGKVSLGRGWIKIT